MVYICKNISFTLIIIAIINCALGNIRHAFKEHEVVPDLIDEAPRHPLEVSYPSNLKVHGGNELTPTQVKDIPTLKWKGDNNSFYTLTLSDLDAPSRQNPESREFVHWIVVNIPGSDLSAGETIYEYIGSGSPKGTGLHRYVFLIHKQPSKLVFDEPKVSRTSPAHRNLFSTRNFVKKYNLGSAVFGNFYQAQYDDYVPILHQQLGVE